MRVAIVDDDEAVRKALARLLAAHSFDTEVFGSALEFATSLRLRNFECLILDLHMPDITGLELQQHLHNIGVVIPTIMVTAHNEIGLRERCVAAGITSFLIKPLDSEALIEAINRATVRHNGNGCGSKGAA